VSQWLPEGAPGRRVGAETAVAGPRKDASDSPSQPAARDPIKQADGDTKRVGEETRTLTLIVEGLTEKLEALERRIDARMRQLERRVAAAEAASRQPSQRAPEPQQAPPAPSSAQAGPPAPHGGTDLNTIRFEDLRAMGLSVTQASRVVTTRHERGGFRSLDELDELPGFSRHLLAELKRTLTVSA
jgi:DNA uptake protein ComE-like DNA-binding protein